MPFSLALAVRKSTRIRRRTITLAAIESTRAQAVELARVHAPILNGWTEQARARILPAYERAIAARQRALTGDDANDLGEELGTSADVLERLTVTLTPRLRGVAVAIEQWHRAAWIARVRAATGVNVSIVVGAPGAAETIDAFYNRNLELIRSVSEETRRRIGQAVWAGYEQITPRATIAREIDAAVGLGKARAWRIAVDQTTKLSAALDQQRQREAGIEKYAWKHSRKKHPRLEHVARDGKVFSWDKPPRGGPPGTEPFCGCHAEAILDLNSEESANAGSLA